MDEAMRDVMKNILFSSLIIAYVSAQTSAQLYNEVKYDREGRISSGIIIHARGNPTDPNKRRVRYDNLLSTFRPWWNGRFSGGVFEYNFLRFSWE